MATADPPTDPPVDPPEDDETAAKTKFEGWFKDAMDKWVEDNRPAPKRTTQGADKNWFNTLFGG